MTKRRKKPEPMLFKEMQAEADRDAETSERYRMFEAIGAACDYDLSLTPRSGCGVLWAAVKELTEIGATPDEVQPTMVKLLELKKGNENFRTPMSLVRNWSATRKAMRPQYRTVVKPAEDAYDSKAEAAVCAARALRVSDLPSAEYGRLRAHVLAAAEDNPFMVDCLNQSEAQLNYQICEALDAEESNG